MNLWLSRSGKKKVQHFRSNIKNASATRAVLLINGCCFYHFPLHSKPMLQSMISFLLLMCKIYIHYYLLVNIFFFAIFSNTLFFERFFFFVLYRNVASQSIVNSFLVFFFHSGYAVDMERLIEYLREEIHWGALNTVLFI